MTLSHTSKSKFFIYTFFLFIINTNFAIGQNNQVDSLLKFKLPNQASIIKEMKLIKAVNIARIAKANIQFFIIKAEENTFGYSIFIDGSMVIEQKTIPSLSGNLGFLDIDIAEKVAQLVIKKMKDGEMLPTISQEEVSLILNN